MRACRLTPVVLAALAGVAHADGDPIAVASTDAGFRRALDRALAPAGMTILPVAQFETPPIVDIANASRAIADRERATATVWLLFSADGATLVAYDRDVDRVLVRELPFASPLDEAQAAQAARMARTMLRALRVTPDTDQLPPRAADAPVVRERVRAFVEAPVAAPERARFGIEVDAGVRVRGPGERAGFAGTLALAWRPEALGLALAARWAPSTSIVRGDLDGRIADASLAVLVRQPLRVSPRWTVVASGGLAIHRVTLDGALGGMAIGDRAYDPALRLGLTATTPLGRSVGLGVAMWSDWLLRRQVYEVGETAVLTVPLVQVTAGVILTARIL